jgi:uncharacterized protein DUF4381
MQDTIQISGIGPMIVPEGVAAWPPAPGWYAVFALVCLLLIFFLGRFARSWRSNGYRREALRQLESIRNLASEQVLAVDIASLNRLLKITAMNHYTRERVASLSGKQWLEFLNSNCSGSNFTTAPGNLLADSGFQAPTQLNITPDQWTGLLEETKRWIRKHQ